MLGVDHLSGKRHFERAPPRHMFNDNVFAGVEFERSRLTRMCCKQDMNAVRMRCGIWREACDMAKVARDMAGFFQQLPRAGDERIAFMRIHHAARQFERNDASAVTILANENQPVVVVEGCNVNPIGIFEHIIGIERHAARRDAAVLA